MRHANCSFRECSRPLLAAADNRGARLPLPQFVINLIFIAATARLREHPYFKSMKHSESHKKLIAILHLIHGFLAASTAIGVFLSVALMVGFKAAMEKWIFPIDYGTEWNVELWVGAFVVVVMAIYLVGALLFTVPALAGGFGLLRGKRWARKFLLISAVVAALDVPFGTALAVYTFWFLFGSGQNLSGFRE